MKKQIKRTVQLGALLSVVMVAFGAGAGSHAAQVTGPGSIDVSNANGGAPTQGQLSFLGYRFGETLESTGLQECPLKTSTGWTKTPPPFRRDVKYTYACTYPFWSNRDGRDAPLLQNDCYQRRTDLDICRASRGTNRPEANRGPLFNRDIMLYASNPPNYIVLRYDREIDGFFQVDEERRLQSAFVRTRAKGADEAKGDLIAKFGKPTDIEKTNYLLNNGNNVELYTFKWNLPHLIVSYTPILPKTYTKYTTTQVVSSSLRNRLLGITDTQRVPTGTGTTFSRGNLSIRTPYADQIIKSRQVKNQKKL